MSEEPVTLPEDECETARIQARNVLTSWYNRRNEQIAQMKAAGTISGEWIQKYETVLKSVKDEIEKIDDALGSGCAALKQSKGVKNAGT